MPEKTLAKMIGRSHTFLRDRIKNLGLVIPREIVEQRIADSRFKKGHVPINKGKLMPDGLYEKASKTMFKKGHLPVNTKYDGYISIRIDKCGRPYAYVRVAQGVFELLHRKNWKTEIRPDILKRAGDKCEICGAPNHTVILRSGDTFEVLENSTSLEALEIDGARLTKVVLTIAHMDHINTHNSYDNLKALCQKCHLHHDKYQHRQTRESKKSLMIEF